MLKRVTIAIFLPLVLVFVSLGILPHISPEITRAQDVAPPIAPSGWPIRSCAAHPRYLLLSMYANTSGIDRIFIQCGDKTVQRYQLDRVGAYDKVLTIFSEFTPPADEVCTASFYNRAGMFVQSRLSPTGFMTPPSCDQPGGDYAAGDIPYPPPDTQIILPDGGRSSAQVALLNSGFVYAAAQLLLTELAEPVRLVSPHFDPFALAQQLPILFIPSGGLDMLQDSTAFQARLETYTGQGGTVIVLAQPHGRLYTLLPGGQLSGSGWHEDEGYLSLPVTIGRDHPALKGLEQATFSGHSRGYLADPPLGGQVLLKRADNKPVALIYPYQQGQVVATTLYEDWRCATGQCSPPTHLFLRDLLSWAIAGDGVPVTVPGDTVALTLPVTNLGRSHADGVELSLITPERIIVQRQVLSASLEPGTSTTLPFNTIAAGPPGIWRVDATVIRKSDYFNFPLAPRTPITYFLVTGPEKVPPILTSTRDLSAKIELTVIPSLNKSVYTPGETAHLKLAVTPAKEGKTNLSARVRYGDFEAVQPLVLSGQTGQTVTFSIPMIPEQGDTLSYGLYDVAGNGLYLNTTRLYFKRPLDQLSIYPDKAVYTSGETIRVSVATSQTGVVQLQAPGYTQTLSMTGQITTVTFPAPASRGEYPLTAMLDNGPYRPPTRVQTYVTVATPQVRISEVQLTGLPAAPDDWIEGSVTVEASQPIEAMWQIRLDYPDGTRGGFIMQPVSLEAGTRVLTMALPLATTQAGSHLLTIQVVDALQPDLVYSASSRVFEVGTAMLLGITTPSFQSLRDGPLQSIPVTAAIFAITETLADLVWYLDDQRITSQNLSLISGTQALSLTLPPPATPGWHTLRADLIANGLTGQATTEFAYQTFGPDIVVRSPQLYKPSGYTATVYTYLYNLGDRQTPTTTVKLYDGHPAAGGELIGAAPVPPLPPRKPFYNHTEEIYLAWDVRGKAGAHTLYAVADADDAVPEIDEDNNIVSAEGDVPPFTLDPRTDKESYARGEPVVASIGVANLQRRELTLTLTLVADLLGFKPFRLTDTLTVPAQTMITPQYVWSATDTRGGVYNLVVDAGEVREYSQFSLPYTAQFSAQPLTGTAPLTVTFTDLSTPWGWIGTWQWDFGDGQTSTEANPVHIYKQAGLYTVTLTTTVPLTGLFSEGQQKITEQGYFAKQSSAEAFVFTVTHPLIVTASR